MIALDYQPFSIVEDEGCRQLLNYLEPRYASPSRRYFLDVALPKPYSVVYSHLKKLLADVAFVIFTTDIWTSSVSPISMLSLTAQWIDQHFILEKAILYTQEGPGSH